MKKLFIIIPIVIVVAAAVVLGLFAAGVFGNKTDEPVARAIEASKSELGVFKGLGTDAYFDISAAKDPSTALDNFVLIRDNKGDKVPLKSTRRGNGVYRITALEGFKARTSYQIWATGSTFVDEKYAGLSTFIFMTEGEEVEDVKVKDTLKQTTIDGTVVEKIVNSDGAINYNITLPEAVAGHYVKGDVILAKKPADDLISDEYKGIYTGDIEGYAYNGMAAYYVERTSETKDGKEEVYCRLASVNEVVDDLNIYKTLTIDDGNFTVNEELLQQALEESDFTAAVYESALEAFDLFSGKFEKTVKDSPKMVARFEYDVSTDKIQLDFYFTITLAKGMDVVFAVKNTINITPNVNAQLNDLSNMDFDLDLGVNLKTKTVCTIDMETTDAKLQATDIDDFKQKFKDIVSGKTAEKGIIGAELPIYSYKYPIYCFVLGIEFGVDINLGLKAQIAFEYDYYTDITVGVTYVNGDISTYKSIDTSSEAKDLVLLGKIKAEAGVYVKLTASLLEVAGVGLKVKTGAYAEIGGQIRLDMTAAIENKELRVLAGYYVTGGLYLALGFELKAGLTLPDPIGFKGWDKYWEPARWEFPLFEFGSKYIVDSFVNSDMEMEIAGKTAEVGKIKVNAFDLDSVSDAKDIEIGIDAFNIEYLDDAASYITVDGGRVTVNPTVGTEFSAKVKITPKMGSDAVATITFHKAAVQPTCDVTSQTFDIMDPADVTFDVRKNQSSFYALTGENITANFYSVDYDGAVTIAKTFLSTLSVGEHEFTYVSDKGRVLLTVNVINTTPITVDKSTATFLKSAKANATFKLNLSGNKVTEIEGLNKGEYSVDSAGTLVIYSLYLMTKEEGSYDYVVNASNGRDLPLTVNVEDDRQPTLMATSYDFSKNSCTGDVKVSYSSYKYELDSVVGNGIKSTDYTARDGVLTIKKTFLTTLSNGANTFRLVFKRGAQTVNKDITVTIKENATIIASVAAATFDKKDPKDVTFVVLATSDVTLSGNGIGGHYRKENGTSFIVDASYLATKEVGSYDFTASAAGATVSLSLEIIDTSVPEIKLEEGASAEITYDKNADNVDASQKKRDFTILLPAGATFSKLDGYGITADDYTLHKDGSATQIVINEAFVMALRVGKYEFSVLTSVNVSTLTLNVVDSSMPQPLTPTTLAYTLGEEKDLTVTFYNFEHDIKSLSVNQGEVISLFAGDCAFDVATGVFTLKASYLETLPANTYVTIKLVFNDTASTEYKITITVNV